MSEERLRVAVIIGSTREGRFGPVVAQWFLRQAEQREDMSVDAIDLFDVGLPAVMPAARSAAVAAYADRLGAADGFVVVTPEYNHGYPASVKQAIDVTRDEWNAKPVAFVSYGGLSGGMRAVEQLRQVFPELHAMTIRDTVAFVGGPWGVFDDMGEPRDTTPYVAATKSMLDQLAWWARALRTARATHPYGP